MGEEVFEAIRKRVAEEPYAEKMGIIFSFLEL